MSTGSTRRRAARDARDAARYRWRVSGAPPALERLGHSSWVPELVMQLVALTAVVGVAVSWLVPAIVAGATLGWDTTLDGGPARAASLSGPAWMYGLVGLAFIAIAAGGVPYLVRETRRRRLPTAILRLDPAHLTVHTLQDLAHVTRAPKPRVRELPFSLEWRDVEGVDPGDGGAGARPRLLVRRAAAERLGMPLADGDAVWIEIRGDRRDVPVLAQYLTGRRAQRDLGSEASLRLAQRLSSTA